MEVQRQLRSNMLFSSVCSSNSRRLTKKSQNIFWRASRIRLQRSRSSSPAEKLCIGKGKEDEGWNLKSSERLLRKLLNIDPDTITADTTFVDDLGADSLDIFQIIMGMEEEYDIELENEAAEQIRTVGDAVEAIRAIR